MKPALLKYLRCPICSLNFELKISEQQPVILSAKEKKIILKRNGKISEYETEILKGSLICKKCELLYAIYEGVPRIYKGPQKDFPIDDNIDISGTKVSKNLNEKHVQTSFTREWDEFNYDDNIIWLWTIDERIDTFCEEIGIASPEDIKGKLMIDAGCGSGILSKNLSERYLVEIIAFDISPVVSRAFRVNKSNLCHFIQASVFEPPLAHNISDITYSHGVLHHTHNTKKAFEAIAKLTNHGGLLYVWLYGKKKGWNRFRFIFIRTARMIISRLPKYLQTFMVYVMASFHLIILLMKRLLGMKRARIRTKNQFLVGVRDKYTPRYAREHREDEVKGWFIKTGHKNVVRRTSWEKTRVWIGSTDLSIKGNRK